MDDLVELQVRVVDSDESDGILEDFDGYRMRTCLQSHLRNQAQGRLPKLQNIRKRDSEIADYLEHLEAQIVILATRIASDNQMASADVQAETEVSMSATGLSFCSNLSDVVPGQLLEVRMLLSTSGTEVLALAEVLRVESAENGVCQGEQTVKISTCYTKIHPDDTEAVIRHMAKLQLLHLQARRDES